MKPVNHQICIVILLGFLTSSAFSQRVRKASFQRNRHTTGLLVGYHFSPGTFSFALSRPLLYRAAQTYNIRNRQIHVPPKRLELSLGCEAIWQS